MFISDTVYLQALVYVFLNLASNFEVKHMCL